jgi:hypothetical protein
MYTQYREDRKRSPYKYSTGERNNECQGFYSCMTGDRSEFDRMMIKKHRDKVPMIIPAVIDIKGWK